MRRPHFLAFFALLLSLVVAPLAGATPPVAQHVEPAVAAVAVFRLDTKSWMKDPGGKGPIYVIKNFAPSVDRAPN
jgi:hypothetical protein